MLIISKPKSNCNLRFYINLTIYHNDINLGIVILLFIIIKFKNNKFKYKILNFFKFNNPNLIYLIPISVILFLDISISKI